MPVRTSGTRLQMICGGTIGTWHWPCTDRRCSMSAPQPDRIPEKGIYFEPAEYERLTCKCGMIATQNMYVDGQFAGVVGDCCQRDELNDYNRQMKESQ